MSNATFLKPAFHKAVVESLLNDIQHRITNYYYYIGKINPWKDETNPEKPVDGLKYGREVQNNIIITKLITPSDVSYIIPRYNWSLNEAGKGRLYDQYDDRYDTTVCGVDLIHPGMGYKIDDVKVYIGSTGSVPWIAEKEFEKNSLIYVENDSNTRLYYICKIGGITGTSLPTHTEFDEYSGSCLLKAVSVDDKNGFGATATLTVSSNKITSIILTNAGSGYTEAPSILIVGDNTREAEARVVVSRSSLASAQRIEDAKFYVLTDDFRVYKCLDNNNGGLSSIKPVHVSSTTIQYDDGYIWKYMYTILPSLKNKFLTRDYMPVVNAMQNYYYSVGRINIVRVESIGKNYVSAKIDVAGDGYLESNPLYVLDGFIKEQGSNYPDNPTLVIDAPFSGAQDWEASKKVLMGQRYKHNNNIYEVVVSGTFGFLYPSHTFGQVSNGTTVLKYIGTTITGTLNAVNGEITSIVLNKRVKSIDLDTGGTGYNHIPSVTLSDNTKGTVNNVVVQNGSITFIEIVEPGNDYTITPSVIIGNPWKVGQYLSNNDQIFYGSNLYTAITSGLLGEEPPTHSVIGQEVLNGTVKLRCVGRAAKASVSMNCGVGYSEKPGVIIDGFTQWYPYTQVVKNQRLYYKNNRYIVTNVLDDIGQTGENPPTHTEGTIVNGNVEMMWVGIQSTIEIVVEKSEAIMYPVIQNGHIVDVRIIDPGVGYSYVSLDVKNYNDASDEGSIGESASLAADLYIGDVRSPQSNIELLATTGEINCIPVISGGYNYDNNSAKGYSETTTVEIVGNGTGASAVALVEDGRLIKIKMTNYGKNYTQAQIFITSPVGYGATARAIIGPYGGHGKNAVEELFAQKLMFFSSITKDVNQGFNVSNDYRQMGILKSPREYKSNTFLTMSNASACWVVYGDASLDDVFQDDSIITNESGFRFRIVASNIADPVVYAASMDDVVPDIGAILTDRDNNQYVVIYINQASMEIRANAVNKNIPTAGTLIVSTSGEKYEIKSTSRPLTSLLLQSLDDVEPNQGSTLSNNVNDLFVIRDVTPPTIDKYSGNLIFVNNRMPFDPTLEQTITFKTILEF